MTHGIGQGGIVGTVHGVFAVDTRVATRTVVVDQQSLQAQGLVDDGVQLQQIVTLHGGTVAVTSAPGSNG